MWRIQNVLLGFRWRVKFVLSFWSLIDLATLVPYAFFILKYPSSEDMDETNRGLFSIVKTIRLIRLERQIKTFSLYQRAFRDSGSWLISCASFVIVVLALCSTTLHFTERHEYSFYSIPDWLFVVILMLCGEAPITDLPLWAFCGSAMPPYWHFIAQYYH